MSLASEILDFYRNLKLPEKGLPKDVGVLNPYADASDELWQVIGQFYHQYYDDDRPRGLILGINPGRLGAGATGIPFTDSYALEEHCNIVFPGDTRETSAAFVYEVIQAYGGAKKFYRDWFIGAASPLGFVRKNEKANWVNWNYYDQASLYKVVRPFMEEQLRAQVRICRDPGRAVVFGAGKNLKYLHEINRDLHLFTELIPLEHPRYIMQYKRKQLPEYVEKFLRVLHENRPG